MKYFLGNKDGLDYVDHISEIYDNIDTGAVEGECKDRLYYIKRLRNPKATSFGTVYKKKLSFCQRNSLKAKLIMLFGKQIILPKLICSDLEQHNNSEKSL